MKSKNSDNLISDNRRAGFEYFLSDFIEVGIVLKGTEIKSIRKHNVSLVDTYISFSNNEAFIINLHIPPYEKGNIFNHEPRRTRKLLMHKREIIKYASKADVDGFSVVPTKIYFKNGRVKLAIALGKGKKNYDKRETIKRRDDERAMAKAIRQGSKHNDN